MYKKSSKIVIVGCSPCGIGAGWYLYKKGYNNWVIYEKNDYPGGLAASFKDEKDFVWDIGGHVLFSRYKVFSEFLNEVLEKDYLTHKRDSWIRIFDTWVPYPFQNNIHYLPEDKLQECVKGLKESTHRNCKANNFKEWAMNTFGRGISEYFLIPMNRKMWSYPLEVISIEWMEKRISPVNLEVFKQNIKENKISDDWGPNSKFIYPMYGGVGQVFRKAIDRFSDKVRLGHQVDKVDLDSKKISFKNGCDDRFDILINTANLKDFISMIYPQNQQMIEVSRRLKCNKLLIVGIGLKRRRKDQRCWLYFPEEKYPFFRVTNLSNYSPYNVPNGDVQSYSSLLIEISFPENTSINKKSLIKETIKGLIDTGLLLESDRSLIESTFSLELDYAYPIPTLDRDAALNKINSFLEPRGIFSRGRFGAFRYEKGNMDDSFMQGHEVAKEIVGSP